ncbi:enoyl-CoA hydratase-related protein [Paractinoplanes atraurantiacus]|uniref:Polyketide biosynthesis enoyl-CoA hydratase PksH n=1 Tax=Paractinoplanes atraurantiacus TaxID=1036182 RepID=A0A285GLH8_9ACTN|nr:enoyl-CoA hydratase-related protein [Actinoplanes atraurantiacus]SNY24422.1 polyketide biosynthesis enoyl-CoA hydratase PksH [Actinoplanes atraurantiacus]
MGLTERTATLRTVSIDRGDGANSVDEAMVARLHEALDRAEADPDCRMLLITSGDGVFSTGMNLAAAASGEAPEAAGRAFFDLMRRFTGVPLMVAAHVDGQVAGGGVGLVAACDLVLASERSTFALPEALWGLLPCCVLPFLVRRIGFQRAYAMTLTTRPVPAADAARSGLADEVAADLTGPVRRLAYRAGKLDTATVAALKRYAGALWPVTAETRELAVGELGRLMATPAVHERLTAFAESGRLPWDR